LRVEGPVTVGSSACHPGLKRREKKEFGGARTWHQQRNAEFQVCFWGFPLTEGWRCIHCFQVVFTQYQYSYSREKTASCSRLLFFRDLCV
jgi:hypothetical protein